MNVAERFERLTTCVSVRYVSASCTCLFRIPGHVVGKTSCVMS